MSGMIVILAGVVASQHVIAHLLVEIHVSATASNTPTIAGKAPFDLAIARAALFALG